MTRCWPCEGGCVHLIARTLHHAGAGVDEESIHAVEPPFEDLEVCSHGKLVELTRGANGHHVDLLEVSDVPVELLEPCGRTNDGGVRARPPRLVDGGPHGVKAGLVYVGVGMELGLRRGGTCLRLRCRSHYSEDAGHSVSGDVRLERLLLLTLCSPRACLQNCWKTMNLIVVQ
jgi:hypothetical protein